MGKIIALRGASNKGKTTTIKILDNLLREASYFLLPRGRKSCGPKDFCDVYQKRDAGGKVLLTVAVTSRGDNEDVLVKDFEHFRKASEACDVYVCACHTKGDTILYLEEMVKNNDNYSKLDFMIKKTSETDEGQDRANASDAQKLLDIIEQ